MGIHMTLITELAVTKTMIDMRSDPRPSGMRVFFLLLLFSRGPSDYVFLFADLLWRSLPSRVCVCCSPLGVSPLPSELIHHKSPWPGKYLLLTML